MAKKKPMSFERFYGLFSEVHGLAHKFDDPETGIIVLMDAVLTLSSGCKNVVTRDAIEALHERVQRQYAWKPEARA